MEEDDKNVLINYNDVIRNLVPVVDDKLGDSKMNMKITWTISNLTKLKAQRNIKRI